MNATLKRITAPNSKVRFVLLWIGVIIVHLQAQSQSNVYSGYASPNIDNSVYTAMQNIWYANEKISYLSFLPIINNQLTPVIPLKEGEGKNPLHILEGNLYFQIPIVMGRNHADHSFQTYRLTFNAGFNVRMTTDSSSPLIPYNDIFGVTFDKILWSSYTGFHGDNNYMPYEDWKAVEKPLHNVSFALTANHYSNGQQPGFFLRDTVNGVSLRRNNYKKGDFSTNYINTGLTYSYLSKKRNLYSANLAYQWDGNFFGPLSYSVEQEKSYGHHRLTSFIQGIWLFQRNTDAEVAYDLCEGRKVPIKLKKYYQFRLRVEPSFILGDLSDYNVPTGRKYRGSVHAFVEFTRPNWRALGFLFHLYAGRDYANIRYDMPIIATMFGLSVNFNKYYPAFGNKMRFMDK